MSFGPYLYLLCIGAAAAFLLALIVSYLHFLMPRPKAYGVFVDPEDDDDVF